MNFIYSFIARAVSAVASFITAKLAIIFPLLPKSFENHKDTVTLVITLILFLVLECFATLKPQIDLKKTRKRMADAIFDEWRKNLKFTDGTPVIGMRINVLLFKWALIPNLSRFPFKKWAMAYRDNGLMKKAADRNIKFKVNQGAIGKAYRTNNANTLHKENLGGFADDAAKLQYLTGKIKDGGLGMNEKQAKLTLPVLAIATVLLVEKNKVVGALNLDAVEARTAQALLEDEDLKNAILELAEFGEKIYCKGE